MATQTTPRSALGLPLFDFLEGDAAAYLNARLIVRSYALHDVVLREGDLPEGLAVVSAGRVDVRRYDLETGVDVLLNVLEPGDFFAEMSLISGEAASATITALAPTTVSYVRRSDFWDLLVTHPMLGLNMCRAQVQRLGRTNRRIRLRHVNLSLTAPRAQALKLVPKALIRAHRIVPIDSSDGVLVLGMVDPADRTALDLVRQQAVGYAVDPVRISATDFATFVAHFDPA